MDMRECLTVGSMEGLGRVERTDGDVVPVRISERKLRGSSAGIHVWLFFQPADESARPWQSYVKVVDPEKQEEAVSRLGVVGACQRRMLVGTCFLNSLNPSLIRVGRRKKIERTKRKIGIAAATKAMILKIIVHSF
jgi:DNA-directed RNA polymerase subunit N (RpoN/RPB10)